MEKARYIGVVLAGGKSSRMGSSKAEIRLNGLSLLEHSLSKFESISKVRPLEQVLISGSFDNQNSVPDLFPEKGPLGGLHSVVKHLCGSDPELVLIVMPVDMPLLKFELLERLVSELSIEISSVHYKDYQLPLVLRLEEAVCNELEELVTKEMDRSNCSIRGLVSKIDSAGLSKVLELSEEERRFLININTPQDLELHKESSTS